jgi:hypothetical protein
MFVGQSNQKRVSQDGLFLPMKVPQTSLFRATHHTFLSKCLTLLLSPMQWHFHWQASLTFLLVHMYLYPSFPAPTSRSTSWDHVLPWRWRQHVLQSIGILHHYMAHNPEDLNLNLCHCENVNSHILLFIFLNIYLNEICIVWKITTIQNVKTLDWTVILLSPPHKNS